MILEPPVRSFKSSLVMMKWSESWGSSPKHRHMITLLKFTQ
jgi:hypothetical protein